MDSPFRIPLSPTGDEWVEERLTYKAMARPKSKFQTVLDSTRLFGRGDARTSIVTRARRGAEGEVVADIDVVHTLPEMVLEETLSLLATGRGEQVVCGKLVRKLGEARHKEIDFAKTPFAMPQSTYPEVLLPFLMRRQPLDGQRRACYSWTSDRMLARVYYEARGRQKVSVPAGRFETREVWMYPDLNDWIALGSVVTKLAKPLLPRYSMWFETAAPHRCIRFEGPYGPPGAPEVILELVEG